MIPEFTLLRIAEKLHATYGVLMEDYQPWLLTLEDAWMGNQRNISCIPEGPYKCRRVQSPKFGDTFEVTNVPGRSHILFHSGNDQDDTSGCILLGSEWGKNRDEVIVAESRKAVDKFMHRLTHTDEFNLYIRG